MSWLVIDAGSQAVKWAHSDAEGNRFLGTGVEVRLSLEPLAQRLANVWRVPRASAAFGCCVADDETLLQIERAAFDAAGIRVTWLRAQRHFAGRGPGYGLALINTYRDTLDLQADRWHAMIAACAKFPGESLVLVNVGATMSVDFIHGQPARAAIFIGGVIAPGVQAMIDAVARVTERLPATNGAIVTNPDNTDDAIVTGVAHAQIGLIERRTREFAAELAREGLPLPRVLLSGARVRSLLGPLARSLVADGHASAVSIEDNLVLRGVALRAHAEVADDPHLLPARPAVRVETQPAAVTAATAATHAATEAHAAETSPAREPGAQSNGPAGAPAPEAATTPEAPADAPRAADESPRPDDALTVAAPTASAPTVPAPAGMAVAAVSAADAAPAVAATAATRTHELPTLSFAAALMASLREGMQR